MQRGRLPAAIGRGDANVNVLRRGLSVFRENIEIASIDKYTRVNQLELRVVLAATPIFFHQPVIGEFRLGIFVKCLHVRVSRRRVEIEIGFLDIFAVIALGTREAKEAFFENGISAVPKRQGEAQPALPIANAEQAILAPPVGPAARMIVGKKVPTGPVAGVVFADGSPLPFGQIGSPAFPIFLPAGIFLETLIFGGGFLEVRHEWVSRGSSFKAAEFMQ